MLTTMVVLVIVLGLMVSLARYVRERSSQALSKKLLRQLDVAMTECVARHGGTIPATSAFPPPQIESSTGGRALETRPFDRGLLRDAALLNNRGAVRALEAEGEVARQALSDLPASIYHDGTLYDAWGTPIVFMATKHPLVGTAPRSKTYFFFSAGPDRDYLSRFDNLYSYEEMAGER